MAFDLGYFLGNAIPAAQQSYGNMLKLNEASQAAEESNKRAMALRNYAAATQPQRAPTMGALSTSGVSPQGGMPVVPTGNAAGGAGPASPYGSALPPGQIDINALMRAVQDTGASPGAQGMMMTNIMSMLKPQESNELRYNQLANAAEFNQQKMALGQDKLQASFDIAKERIDAQREMLNTRLNAQSDALNKKIDAVKENIELRAKYANKPIEEITKELTTVGNVLSKTDAKSPRYNALAAKFDALTGLLDERRQGGGTAGTLSPTAQSNVQDDPLGLFSGK